MDDIKERLRELRARVARGADVDPIEEKILHLEILAAIIDNLHDSKELEARVVTLEKGYEAVKLDNHVIKAVQDARLHYERDLKAEAEQRKSTITVICTVLGVLIVIGGIIAGVAQSIK